MANIYSNCALSNAATVSANCNGGCLFDRWRSQKYLSNTPMDAVEIILDSNTQHEICVHPVAESVHDTFLTEADRQVHDESA
jgi:hypothetical protein